MYKRIAFGCLLLGLCVTFADVKAKSDDTLYILDLRKQVGELQQNNKGDSAMQVAQKGYSLSKQENYIRGEAIFLVVIGAYHIHNGEFSRGIDTLLKARKIFESLGDIEGLSKCYLQMGVSRYSQKLFSEALEDFRENYKYLKLLAMQKMC